MKTQNLPENLPDPKDLSQDERLKFLSQFRDLAQTQDLDLETLKFVVQIAQIERALRANKATEKIKTPPQNENILFEDL